VYGKEGPWNDETGTPLVAAVFAAWRVTTHISPPPPTPASVAQVPLSQPGAVLVHRFICGGGGSCPGWQGIEQGGARDVGVGLVPRLHRPWLPPLPQLPAVDLSGGV
jgi:hypothetical protein